MDNGFKLVKKYRTMGTTAKIYSGDGEVWMTRKAIGEMLGYADPQKAIDKIHSRNEERLNKYSVTIKLDAPDSKEYDTVLYSRKGVYEICRWSSQPKANEFFDKVYDILEEVRTNGYYGQLTSNEAMEICRKQKVSVEEYCKYRTGKEFNEYAVANVKLLPAKSTAETNYGLYNYSMLQIQKESGLARDKIAAVLFEHKIDKRRDCCKWFDDDGWRFTWFGRFLLTNALPVDSSRTYY